MATLIPALGTCLLRMTAGERRRSEQFKFEGAGVQVQGRTAGLKFDCRDTRQIQLFASLQEEAFAIADPLSHAHGGGQTWGGMAVSCTDWKSMELSVNALTQRKVPHCL